MGYSQQQRITLFFLGRGRLLFCARLLVAGQEANFINALLYGVGNIKAFEAEWIFHGVMF